MAEVKPKSTKEEGIVYVSSTGLTWGSQDSTKEKPTAKKLKGLRENIYGRGISEKLNRLIFTEQFTIMAWDPKGKEDQELSNLLTRRFTKTVDLWTAMQQAYEDVFWYGPYLSNPVWGYGDEESGIPPNEYYLKKIRRLPPPSFQNAPSGAEDIDDKTYSEILKGICLDTKGNIVFYQTDNDGESKKIENCFMVKDPRSTDLAGEPIILPLIRVITMLDYTWLAQMQKVNRTGSPIMFIRIDSTHPEAQPDDAEYAQKILENWGKNTAFTLRPNMELISTQIKDTSDNLETIKALNAMIVDYFSPSGWVSKDGTLIGGSSAPEVELMQSYIKGVHSWLQKSFVKLVYKYLTANGYKDYDAEIIIPAPSVDRSELMLKVFDSGTREGLLTDEEAREILPYDLGPLTDEKRAELERKRSALPASFSIVPDKKRPAANPDNVEDAEEEEEAHTHKSKAPTEDEIDRELGDALAQTYIKTQKSIMEVLKDL